MRGWSRLRSSYKVFFDQLGLLQAAQRTPFSMSETKLGLRQFVRRVPKSVCSGFENALREVEESVLPMVKIVAVIIHMPDMRHIFLLQVSMHTLADADEVVFVAGGNPKEFQLLRGGYGIRHQLCGGPRIRSGGEPAHPGEGIQIPEAEVQRLAAAHRQASKCPALAVCLD